jgi:hypothetical protein
VSRGHRTGSHRRGSHRRGSDWRGSHRRGSDWRRSRRSGSPRRGHHGWRTHQGLFHRRERGSHRGGRRLDGLCRGCLTPRCGRRWHRRGCGSGGCGPRQRRWCGRTRELWRRRDLSRRRGATRGWWRRRRQRGRLWRRCLSAEAERRERRGRFGRRAIVNGGRLVLVRGVRGRRRRSRRRRARHGASYRELRSRR